jgi:TMEM175 potassium channel family protein
LNYPERLRGGGRRCPVDRSRLEAFSDGVFAVAITLLALNLAVPGPGHRQSLLSQLASHWPAFVAYVISFFTIGIIWVNHHALVQNIARVDRTLLFLNLLLLACVVAIPFATATMADYLKTGGQDARVAMALYAAVFEAMSLAFMALFEWTLHEDSRTHHPVPETARWAARRRFYLGQLPYLIAIGVAFISPLAALAIIGLVAVYYIFERTPSPARAPAGDQPGEEQQP